MPEFSAGPLSKKICNCSVFENISQFSLSSKEYSKLEENPISETWKNEINDINAEHHWAACFSHQG